MANLTIQIGNVSATVTTNDASATSLIAAYIRQYGGPQTGTPEARLRWFVNHLAKHIKDVADYREVGDTLEQTRQQLIAERQAMRFAEAANGNGR